MALPKPNIVIFDMDGTTVRHLNPYIIEITEKIDDFTFRAHKFLSVLAGMKKPRPPAPRKKFSPKLLAHKTLHKMRRKSVDQIVEPCPGVEDLLAFFKKKNVQMGLVSSGLGRGYGHDILESFEFRQYFEHSLFAEDLNRSKPDPAPIVQMLDLLKPDLDKNDVVWVIGDRHKDVKAAINARKLKECFIVPIAYGFFGSGFLAAIENNLNLDHTIASYTDWLVTIENIFKEDISN